MEHGKRAARESASTIRSQLLLEMAAGVVGDPETDLRQTKVVLREQGSLDWSVCLLGSSTYEGVDAVVAGEAVLAMLNPSAALTLACRGTGVYPAPQPLRALAIIPSYDQCVFAVKRETGLTSVEEIAARKVPLRIGVRGQRDHYLQVMLDHVARAAGFTLDELRGWGGGVVHAKSGPPRPGDVKFAALASGEIDAIFDEGVSGWIDTALEAGMTLLPLAEPTIAKLETMGYRRAIIPRGEYAGLSNDVLTLDFSGWAIFVHAGAPDALVTQLCRALDDRKALIPWDGEGPLPVERMSRNDPDTPLDVPLHPAAERFWRGRGYLR
jgi:hypothetical protein